jgi:hypothetical protein
LRLRYHYYLHHYQDYYNDAIHCAHISNNCYDCNSTDIDHVCRDDDNGDAGKKMVGDQMGNTGIWRYYNPGRRYPAHKLRPI